MKRVILSAILATPLAVFCQETYTIEGKVGDLNAPAKVYLSTRGGLDSADIVNGVFKFSGEVERPTAATLVLAHKGEDIRQQREADALNLYLVEGTTTVASADSLSKATLAGTELNKDQGELNVALREVKKLEADLMSFYYGTSDEQRQSPDFEKQVEEKVEAMQSAQLKVQEDFVKTHPSSLVSLYTVSRIDPKRDFEKSKALFEILSNDLRDSEIGKEYRERQDKVAATQVGKIAPEFTQADTTGKPVSLSSFKGKYVLVDFWASWCVPCRQENPNVVAAFNKYKDKNFTVLGVSLDRPNAREAWLGAIKADGLAWTQVSDLKFWENEVAVQYGVRSIPANYLIDPEGKIVAVDLRGEDLVSKLEELL
ncbi:TlpA disulfide reductase family protein [Olivibacter sitiensis]|uniref:TlpA disulfide reductase family protein n=1 Tax=Olivibacter sitiensis TaxID=376470 RepID=UPI00040383DA|nr:TlpA disulfide reductase family protein [Olivibacter sitiensis]